MVNRRFLKLGWEGVQGRLSGHFRPSYGLHIAEHSEVGVHLVVE